jgi:hypothetical protein
MTMAEQPNTPPRRPASPDLTAGIQRWLFRSGARNVGRELHEQVNRALHGEPRSADVWSAATADPPPPEAPECAWCPVCRAARRIRRVHAGASSPLSEAGDAIAAAVQEALAAFDAVLSYPGRRPQDRGEAGQPTAGSAAPAGDRPNHGPDDRG